MNIATTKQRILQFIDYKSISISDFLRKTEIKRGFLDSDKLDSSVSDLFIAKIIACYPEINIEWLVTGNGEMILSNSSTNNSLNNKLSLIPLIPINAIAGIGNGNNDLILQVDCEYYDVPEFRNKADYLIRINGSSMSPKYHSGDIVACKKLPLDTFFQWNKVYVVDTIQGALVKRVKKSQLGNEYIQLISENDKYEPFDIPISAIHALGLVIGVIRLE